MRAILDHLNAVIDWYRNTLTNVPNVGLPSDAMYEFNARSMAAEVAQLAFESASADAALIPTASPASATSTGQTTAQPGLVKMENDVAARIRVLQAQISSLNQQIAGASKAKLQQLTEERDRAQGELDLRNAMHDALGQIVKFSMRMGKTARAAWKAASTSCAVRFRSLPPRAPPRPPPRRHPP